MRASIPTSRRVAVVVVDPGRRAQLAAHQLAGRGLLVGRVDLVERLAGGLVVDALAAQLLGQRPRGQALAAAGRLALAHPGAGEGAVVDQPDLLEPVEQPGRRSRPARPWRPACRRAPCGCAPGRSAGRAGSCGPPTPGRRRALRDSASGGGSVGVPPAVTDPGVARPSRRHPSRRRSTPRSTRAPVRDRTWSSRRLRSRRRRPARRDGRRRLVGRPAGRRRASRGSSSRSRWRGRGCR